MTLRYRIPTIQLASGKHVALKFEKSKPKERRLLQDLHFENHPQNKKVPVLLRYEWFICSRRINLRFSPGLSGMEERFSGDEAALERAIVLLTSSAPGSPEQQEANGFLVRLQEEPRSAGLALGLAEKMLAAKGCCDSKVVFFALQVVLSRIRTWNGELSGNSEMMVRLMPFLTKNAASTANLPLIRSQLRTILAALSVRAVAEQPDILTEILGKFSSPPFVEYLQFLKAIVEELERCWLNLSNTARRITCEAILEVRGYMLDLLHQILHEMQRGIAVSSEVLHNAIQCLHSWCSCVVMSSSSNNFIRREKLDSSENSENSVLNLGVDLRQLYHRKTPQEPMLLDWICEILLTCGPDLPLFHYGVSILVDSIGDQSMPSLATLDEASMKDYKDGVELIAKTMLRAYASVKEWNDERIRFDPEWMLEDGDEEFDMDPMFLKWRAVCMSTSQLCAQHLKCLLFFCDESCIDVLLILLYGLESPIDRTTVEACLAFWDAAGDCMHESFAYLTEWRDQGSEYSPFAEQVPALLTKAGSLELFNRVAEALLSCTIVTFDRTESSATSILALASESLQMICMRWPDLEQTNSTSDNVGLFVRQHSGDAYVRHVLMILHSKLISGEKKGSLMVRGIVRFMIAIAEAAQGFEDEDEVEYEEVDDEDENEVQGFEAQLDRKWEEAGEPSEEVAGSIHPFKEVTHLSSSHTSPRMISSSLNSNSTAGHGSPSDFEVPDGLKDIGIKAPVQNEKFASEKGLPFLWRAVVSDLLLSTWQTSDPVIRRVICEMLGETSQLLCQQSDAGTESWETLCRVYSFVLSSIPVVVSDTCIVAAKAFLKLCRTVSLQRGPILRLQRCVFEIHSVRSDGQFMSARGSQSVKGIDGLLWFIEGSEQMREAFAWSPRTCAVVREGITLLVFRYAMQGLRNAESLSANVKMLRTCLHHQLEPVAQSLQMIHVKGHEMQTQDLMKAVISNLLTLTYVLRGMVASSAGKNGRLVVHEAALPLIEEIWKNFSPICSEILREIAHSFKESEEKPCGTQSFIDLLADFYVQVSLRFDLNASLFVEGMVCHMCGGFELTYSPSCLKALRNLPSMLGGLWNETSVASKTIPPHMLFDPRGSKSSDVTKLVQTVSSAGSRLTKAIIKSVRMLPETGDEIRGRLLLDISDEIYDSSVSGDFFSLLQVFTSSQLLSLAAGRFNCDDDGCVSLLEVVIVLSVTLLLDGAGGFRTGNKISVFLANLLEVYSKESSDVVQLVNFYKPSVFAGCVAYLRRASSSGHNARANVVVGVLLKLKDPDPKSNYAPHRILQRVLALPEFERVPEPSKKAVFDLLLQPGKDRAAFKASVSDASLHLSGMMKFATQKTIHRRSSSADELVDVFS